MEKAEADERDSSRANWEQVDHLLLYAKQSTSRAIAKSQK
jgi:hypothetical protein